MLLPIGKSNHSISKEIRGLISKRYKTITKAVNSEFRNINSDSDYSLYVGSYGRGTAVNTSDLDVLIELPDDEYEHFTSLLGNGASRLLQTVKNAILNTYPRTNIKADGQVVVVKFVDGMKFEILPAFRNIDFGIWNGTYIYPDTHMGGNWLTTNPKIEQQAMKIKNSYNESNGLLFDTCKHIRYIRNEYYSSYHLSGILIDTFVYSFIDGWHWRRDNEISNNNFFGKYEKDKNLEEHLLNTYASCCNAAYLYAPGSNMLVYTQQGWDVLGKILRKMVK